MPQYTKYSKCPTCGFATIYNGKTMTSGGEAVTMTFPTDQPTTGEWMASTVEVMFMANPKNAHYAIADAHNAALASEREKLAECHHLIPKLNDQLAAERERCKDFRAELHSSLEANELLEQQLAAAQSLNLNIERTELPAVEALEQQLAAATARELHSYDVAKVCREELAAEREKAQTLTDTLKKIRQLTDVEMIWELAQEALDETHQ